jgi:HD-like signal output (HDOD) protein
VGKVQVREKLLGALKHLPPFSAAASKFLGTVAKRDAEGVDLVAIIQRDPLLAAHVLELANSGTFGRLQHIHSIQQAVLQIGSSALRRHAIRWTIGGLLTRMPISPGWSVPKFTTHSEAVALLADSLCDHIPVSSADGAFTAGLLHDVGKFFICKETSIRTIVEILNLRDAGGQPVTEYERDILGIDHAEISSMAAQIWGLSDDICQAIRWHHEPEREPNANPTSLAVVLNKSDVAVNGLGFSFLSSRRDAVARIEWLGYSVGMEHALKEFIATVEKTAEAV